MIFLDDKMIKEMVLYKKPVHLPINSDTKLKGSMCFLLSPTFEESIQVLTNPLINTKFYSGYYIEKNITYFINQEAKIVSDDLEYINEAKLTSKERNSLKDSQFGVSHNRSFPLNDEAHVKAAIRMFNNVSPEDEKELATKIKRKIKQFGLNDINIGDNNRLKNYINEEANIYDINNSIPSFIKEDYEINEEYMRCKVDGNDILFIYPEQSDVLTEAVKAHNPMLKRILYNERYKTPKDVFAVYDKVETSFKQNDININKMYINLKKYRGFNLFADLSFYNQTFFKNNIWKLDKGVDLYFDFITRFLKDPRFKKNGYKKQTVILPVFGWTNKKQLVYTNEINVLSMIYRMMYKNLNYLISEWKDIDFLILGKSAYFKINFGNMTRQSIPKFKLLINKLITRDTKEAQDLPDSTEGIKVSIIDKIEKSQSVNLDDSIETKSLTGETNKISKDELIEKIDRAAAVSSSTDDAIDFLDKDEEFKKMIVQLGSQDSDIKINSTRSARMEKLNNDIMGKKIQDKPLKELIEYKQIEELPKTELKIDSINPEWEELKYINFNKSYNIESDIAKILRFFTTRSVPIAIRNIEAEDTSSSEDWVYTYKVDCEDYAGERFKLVFDIPKFKDDRYMYLRGNEKTLNGQLMQLPISKTDQDTVQMVSNYNKIFIRRFGSNAGKSCIVADKIIKSINKLIEEKDTSIKVVHGDNRKIASKYVLPMDYVDLSSEFSRLETKNMIFYFNQDEIRSLYKIDDKKGVPYAVFKKDKEVLYFDEERPFATEDIYYHLMRESRSINNLYDSINESTKYTYSKASILGTEIPVIVIMAYHVGLLKAMEVAGVKYTIEKPRFKYDHLINDAIKFKDAWIVYELNASSSLLMNGLKECDTLNYSISEIGGKEMYLDFLDGFGGRIKSDGLDNFYDLMVDPITLDIIKTYKLPEDYISLLAYANNLLEDNKYIKHADLSGKRFRTNEIVAGLLYNELASSYGQYKIKSKRMAKGNAMTIKQSAVIDALLALKTSSDASILNALLDVEAANSVSFKGLSGMNASRAYDLDKRTYDESMVNVLALSTGFAGNVGITRQSTIDMNIEGTRGIIKSDENTEDIGLKSLCMTEAVTPYSVNHDDTFRSAMTFIQTSKHFMRTETMNPRLITNGSDEALPYMTSSTFAFKTKQSGKIVEKTDEHLILEYKDGSHEFVNLEPKIIKNSSGGFYGSLKLDSDKKVGSTFKAGEIIAYDKNSFSGDVGATDNIAYNAGTLVKMAIIYTDEGIEDSGIITEWLSDALASEVIIKTEVYLSKSTNVFNMVKVGQHVEEGDALINFQEATDDEDINTLMKALGAEEDEISDLGRINKKSKYTGDVVDIKIYHTAEKNEMSDSLKKIVNNYEKVISAKKKVMQKYDIKEEYTLPADYKLPATGKLKNIPDGVLIEFYVRFIDKFKIGDKDVLDAALKNVIKDIIPKGEEPYTEFRPTEEISTLASLNSIEGRMVSSIINNGCLNKILIELDRSVKETLGIPWKPIQEMNK